MFQRFHFLPSIFNLSMMPINLNIKFFLLFKWCLILQQQVNFILYVCFYVYTLKLEFHVV